MSQHGELGPGADPSLPLEVPRVALVMVAIGDLSSSGGAERQFSDLFEHFRQMGPRRVTFITARASLMRLRQAGRLLQTEGVVALPLGSAPARGRASVAWMTALLIVVTLWRRFDLVHLCLPTPSYVPFAAFISRLPRAIRPQVVLNVIDCTLAANLRIRQPEDPYERQVVEAHRLYFRWVRLDGIYTWYEAFADVCRAARLVRENTVVRAARYCFTDPLRFHPDRHKQPVIVFAGRLSEQKRPWLFVEAVARLRDHLPEVIRGWRFEMYGGGLLEARIREMIDSYGLGDLLTLSRTPDLSAVFARTRLFVSTQAFENFTSLAMLEAMAAGNAVIGEDVGQTREFVRHGENGLLATAGTREGFADAIEQYVRHPEWHDRMAAASRQLATDVHTVQHFAADIAGFWREVVR